MRKENNARTGFLEYEQYVRLRNERAGTPRKVAMAISGLKTESIYRRYDIVAQRDLVDAAARMEHYLEGFSKSGMGTLLGTPEGKENRSCESDGEKLLN